MSTNLDTSELVFHVRARNELARSFPEVTPFSSSQMRDVLEGVSATIARNAAREGWDDSTFQKCLIDAFAFVDEMRTVLSAATVTGLNPGGANANGRSQETSKQQLDIWRHRNALLEPTDVKRNRDLWPVEYDTVMELCRRYIAWPWMHCRAIDRVLLDAAFYVEVMEADQLLHSDRADGRLKALTTLLRETGTLVLSLAVGVSAAERFEWWAGVLSGVGLFVILRLYWIMSTKCEREKDLRMRRLIVEMNSAARLMRRDQVNVTTVREQLRIAANNGAVWAAEIYAIIDSAIQRNPVTWK